MHRNWTNGIDGSNFNGMMDLWTQNSGWFLLYDLVKFFVIVGVILIIARMLIKTLGNSEHSNKKSISPSNRAINLLQERYANGEIDEKEYKERLRNLRE